MDETQNKNQCTKYGCHKLLYLDLYDNDYKLRVDAKDKTAQVSFVSCIVTVILCISLGLFAFYRITIVVNRNGWQMVTTTREKYFDQTDEFTAESGFAIAIALWQPIDPRIGELEIVSDEWGTDPETGEDYWRVTPL